MKPSEWKSTRKHIEARVSQASLIEEPWPHFQIEDFFPSETYKQILSNLPRIAEMEQFKSNRYLYWLEIKGKRPSLPPFWLELRDELFDYLWDYLEEKLGVIGQCIGGELLHDLPGYAIAPHTDTPDKLVTGLIYLPVTDEDYKQGTLLYKGHLPDPAGKGNRQTYVNRFPEKTVPYQPNSALFFQRTDWSYHGVLPTPVNRWLLAFDVFKY